MRFPFHLRSHHLAPDYWVVSRRLLWLLLASYTYAADCGSVVKTTGCPHSDDPDSIPAETYSYAASEMHSVKLHLLQRLEKRLIR